MPKPKTPLLTVDAVILYDKKNVVLIRRKNPPFQGDLALPGGFVAGWIMLEDLCMHQLSVLQS